MATKAQYLLELANAADARKLYSDRFNAHRVGQLAREIRDEQNELVELLTLAREKLQIECGGSREYKGGCPSQVLFPRIDALLKKVAA